MDGTKNAAVKINGKNVRGCFSDGETSIIVDYQGETTVLLPLEERETEDFVSQDVNESTVVGRPKYGSITQNISFSPATYQKIEEWYANETLLTYTVSGLFEEDRVYTDILIHIPETPTIDPEKDGYLVNSIGIKSKKGPEKKAT